MSRSVNWAVTRLSVGNRAVWPASCAEVGCRGFPDCGRRRRKARWSGDCLCEAEGARRVTDVGSLCLHREASFVVRQARIGGRHPEPAGPRPEDPDHPSRRLDVLSGADARVPYEAYRAGEVLHVGIEGSTSPDS
jgi:hypothetical protein